MKKCNSTPKPCMFFMPKRMGCAWKFGYNVLKNLNGCEHHRIYDRANYKDLVYDIKDNRGKRMSIDHVVFKRLVTEGLTANQISERLGVSIGYVYVLAKKLELKITSSRTYVRVDLNKLRELADRGFTTQEITEKLNSKVETIRSRAKRNGIEIKHGNRGRPSNNRKGRPKVNEKKVKSK